MPTGPFRKKFVIYRPTIEKCTRLVFLIFVSFWVISRTPALDTLIHLKQSNVDVFQNTNRKLTNLFSPNTGQYVLPNQVRQMLSLLQTFQLSSYRLSDQLYSDPLIVQRITEAAWPVKMNPSSSYLLSTLSEIKNQTACAIIDQRKDIALVYCH
jgi:hypothetical protein